ncbi:MAG: hypothetical protein OEZ39_16255 [Gammaproteobacteria bacterium]|nr:hypothetical protein [Gammaproteobacteria bacterium]MDH5653412.1 hypothetical protein [Gammaproteobacteria bacterium]
MNFDLPKQEYSISVAEELMGEVIGKINSIGGLLKEGCSNSNGIITFSADIPISETLLFTEWLSKFTKGNGKVEKNT